MKKINEKFIDPAMATDAELATEVNSINQTITNLVGRVRHPMLTSTITVSSTTFSKVGNRFIWLNSRNTQYQDGILMFIANIPDLPLEVRLVNTQNGSVLAASATITVSGTYTLTFSSPAIDTTIELQIRTTVNDLLRTAPSINDAAIEFTTI